MIEKISSAIRLFALWIKHWLWEVPTSKPPKEKPIRVKATEVAKEYMVVQYHGQRINLHKNEYPIWKRLGRKDKRAMAAKFTKQEKGGLIKFMEIEGKLICVKNKDYQAKADIYGQ